MRTSPFGDLVELVDRFSRGRPIRPPPFAIDLIDLDERYVLKADLPGVARERIDLSLQDDRLTIDANPGPDDRGIGARYLRRERTREEVSRTVTLPEPIDAAAVEASLEGGVLEVSLPKPTPTGAHRIEVE